MAATPSESALIASTSTKRTETFAPETTYDYLASDWVGHLKILSSMQSTSSSSAQTCPRKRNDVEGCFGTGKRKYSLDLIMARLSKGAETLISMPFLVMRAEKIRRLLCLLFVAICAWFYAWQQLGALWEDLRGILRLELAASSALGKRACEPPTRRLLAASGSSRRFALSGVPK